MSVTLVLSDACAAELRSALAGVVVPVPSPPAVPTLPPVVTPPPPASGQGMQIALPAQGNKDYAVGINPGGSASAWFVMPNAPQVNFGFMYNSGATNLRTFQLSVDGQIVRTTQGKSAMFTLSANSILVAVGSVVQLTVTNAVNGTPTGLPNNAGGFFQIQRPG
jgi:hypothetical protein